MECEDLAASISLLSDCEKVIPSKVVVDKDDEMLMLVFDEARGVGDVKNRRHAFMDKLMNVGKLFSKDSRSGETLLKSAKEALLMEKIQIEQQRLGVDEMYWVGNKRFKEEQEEQKEEEDEYDKEVEERKHRDANVRDVIPCLFFLC
nr:hypothetical protein [Tanacetum cinerariifolium]